ncbi:ABC transporter ATP-binding protein [soil metagenome]
MIHLEAVSKTFGGALRAPFGERVRALDEVSLEVAPGTALGIAGPNGAGKSTLIRLLLGYLRPSGGSVGIAGVPPREYVERHGIGYLPERVELPPRWRVRGALDAFAALAEVGGDAVEGTMGMLGLGEIAERRVGTLSKGNLQRVGLAQAFLAPRRVMVLDEPGDGLDPEWTARLRELLAEWRAADRQRVLLVASHNLAELERLVDSVAVLEDGRLREVIEVGTGAGLQTYLLEVGDDGAAAALVLERFGAETERVGAGRYRVAATDLAALNRALAALLADGVTVRSFGPERDSLERRFRATLAPRHGDAP